MKNTHTVKPVNIILKYVQLEEWHVALIHKFATSLLTPTISPIGLFTEAFLPGAKFSIHVLSSPSLVLYPLPLAEPFNHIRQSICGVTWGMDPSLQQAKI